MPRKHEARAVAESPQTVMARHEVASLVEFIERTEASRRAHAVDLMGKPDLTSDEQADLDAAVAKHHQRRADVRAEAKRRAKWVRRHGEPETGAEAAALRQYVARAAVRRIEREDADDEADLDAEFAAEDAEWEERWEAARLERLERQNGRERPLGPRGRLPAGDSPLGPSEPAQDAPKPRRRNRVSVSFIPLAGTDPEFD